MIRGEALMKIGFGLMSVALAVGLFALLVFTAEKGVKERRCFDAGGRVESGVCMPVNPRSRTNKPLSGG